MKRGFKYIAFLMTLIMTISLSTSTFAMAGPNLTIEHVITLDELIAGTDVNIKLDINNSGTSDAKNVSLSLETVTPGISLIGTTLRTIDEIDPSSSEDVTFGLHLDVHLQAGYYPLTLFGQYESSQGEIITYSETFYVDILGEDARDYVKVQVANEALMTGEDESLELLIENSYLDELKDIEIVPLDSSDITFMSDKIIENNNLAAGSSLSIRSAIYVSDMVSTGVYPIVLEIQYKKGAVSFSELETIYVKVENDGSSSISKEIGILSVIHNKTSIGVEESVITTVTVENLSDQAIDDITLSVNHDPSLIMVSQNKYMIDTLDAGDRVTKSFTFESTKDTPTGNLSIEVMVSYDGGMKVEQYYSGVYMDNDSVSSESSTPRILIDTYTLSKDILYVGDSFDMTLNLMNTSTEKDIKNLKMTISIMDEMGISTNILPVGQSQSMYVGSMDMGEIASVTIPFEILSTAEGKIYTYEFTYEFEDDKGMMYSDSENIHVPVYQESVLTLSDVRIGKILENGYTLEMDFYNTGKSIISNLMIDIEGDFTSLNSNYFVGDFATGRMDVYDVQMQGDAPEVIEGTILYSYDDTFGNTISKEMSFSVENGLFEVEASDELIEEDEPNNPSILPYIIGGLLILVVVGFFIRRRKKAGDA